MAINYGFIVPHPPIAIHEVGKGREREIQNTIDAFMSVARMIKEIQPETIIISTPHSTVYSDYIHISPGKSAAGSFSNFGVRDVFFKVEYDEELVKAISDFAFEEDIPAGTLGERNKELDHGAMVPLYFINKHYTNYKLVRISISGLSSITHYNLGKSINRAVSKLGRNCVFVASGDLSHKLVASGPYGYDEEGPKFDKDITDAMRKADFLKLLTINEERCERAAQCGLQSFNILAGCFDKRNVKPAFMSYEGPFGVGYAVCAYEAAGSDDVRDFAKRALDEMEEKMKKARGKEDAYISLARKSIELYTRTKKVLEMPDDLSKELLERRAGTFVTLKINGKLRGCIGTIEPVCRNIAEEIIRNAISACSKDPRFDPVTEEELPYITYSVDVLGKVEKVQSKLELDPNKYGVIVTKGYRRGLLLPNLDGVDTVEEQLEIALGKAGIGSHEDYTIERFEVVRHEVGDL
ncbi:MAG TPA: AmmeMemoRadiSam system protein A [Clostridiaceae bacterium]|jgi:AmmeMemoRadiSam system protein A/AmmeMemoRadiSam system protein B|nr:AmmeMemoRadiSam system protein A [Clostridiaceae bacterium]